MSSKGFLFSFFYFDRSYDDPHVKWLVIKAVGDILYEGTVCKFDQTVTDLNQTREKGLPLIQRREPDTYSVYLTFFLWSFDNGESHALQPDKKNPYEMRLTGR